MKTLQRKVLGLDFQNPVIPASGTFNFGREINEFYPINKLGALITKGLTREKRLGNLTPRVAETSGGMLNSVGLQNPGVDSFIKDELPFMLSQGVPVIANACGNTVEDYLYVVSKLCETNIAAIELNISCPNVKLGGMSFGVDPVQVENIVQQVRKVCPKPLIVKLTPNVSNIAENAKAAERGGADAISLINTLAGMAVDIQTRRPLLANRIGGLSGPAVKPVALKMVWDVYNAVKIPVIGCGGVSNFKDVIEFMLCGATLVQVGTLNMTDPMATYQIIEELENWCKTNNIKSLDEIVGKLIVN
jgi:dihydroorotate dehydrogenase (NAD+) catalytic subunit